MLRPRNTFTKSTDRISGRGPRKGPGPAVVSLHEVLNLADQLPDAPEGATANSLLGDATEPDLHLVEPGGIRRRVVDMVAGA